MSTNSTEQLRNVKPGRTDWKIQVRVIRKWIVVTRSGEIFKGFNLILLDGKNCRMHAFVPGSISDRLDHILTNGNIYIIKNFKVQQYTEADKFRAVEMDRKIVLTTDTRIKQGQESEIFIPKNMFDFFEYVSLKQRGGQITYLTDVISVLEKKEKLNKYKNSKGVDTMNIRVKISDGRKKFNVTFWGSLAQDFDSTLNETTYDSKIVIIASGRVTAWQGILFFTNKSFSYSPDKSLTISDISHSVAKLRKMWLDLNSKNLNKSSRKKTLKICKFNELRHLDLQFVEEKLVLKGKIKLVDQTSRWNIEICSSCYKEENMYYTSCSRIVPHCLKRFHVTIIAADDTGGLETQLKDREIWTLLNKRLEDLESQGKRYTFKLQVTKDNIVKKNELFVASNIMIRWDYKEEIYPEQDILENTQSKNVEPSGSSYHLDELSQLNYQAKSSSKDH